MALVDMLEWIHALDPNLFAQIPGSSKQSDYVSLVLPRMAKTAALLEEFQGTFAYTPASIREKQFEDLKHRFEEPLHVAKQDFERCAREAISHLVAQAFTDQTYTVRSDSGELRMPMMLPFAILSAALEGLYSPVANEYSKKMDEVRESIGKAIQDCFDLDAKTEKMRKEALTHLCSNCEDYMSVEENADFLIQPVEEIVKKMSFSAMKEFVKVNTIAHIHTIQIQCKNSMYTVHVQREAVKSIEGVGSYSHVKKVFCEMGDTVRECMMEKKDVLISRKENMLYGKDFKDIPWITIHMNEDDYVYVPNGKTRILISRNELKKCAITKEGNYNLEYIHIAQCDGHIHFYNITNKGHAYICSNGIYLWGDQSCSVNPHGLVSLREKSVTDIKSIHCIPEISFVRINDCIVTKKTFDATYQVALNQTMERMKEKGYPTITPYTLEKPDDHWTFAWAKTERSYEASAHHVFQHIFHKYMAKLPIITGDFKAFGDPVINKD
jgi:hypothetical protein